MGMSCKKMWRSNSLVAVSTHGEAEQLHRLYKSQTAAVKSAVRAYKRRKWEDLAGELEQAVSRKQVKSTYAMVKRLAPVQAPPKFTVRQKDGSSTWGHDGEIAARRDALVTIFGAGPLSFEAEPQLLPAKKWIHPETPVHTKVEMRSAAPVSLQGFYSTWKKQSTPSR